jgi:hypothetical protein
MNVVIRLAHAEDAGNLPEVERSAASSFRRLRELAWIADGKPTPAEDYFPLITQGTV